MHASLIPVYGVKLLWNRHRHLTMLTTSPSNDPALPSPHLTSRTKLKNNSQLTAPKVTCAIHPHGPIHPIQSNPIQSTPPLRTSHLTLSFSRERGASDSAYARHVFSVGSTTLGLGERLNFYLLGLFGRVTRENVYTGRFFAVYRLN